MEYLQEKAAMPGQVIGQMEDGTLIRQARPDLPRLESISASELMGKTFEKLSAPVEGLIVEGLTLLCGSSKIGKSWLMLSLACAVAAGRSFLGRETQQGDVRYLALEDSERRLQTRLKKLGENPGDTLSFSTRCRTLDSGLTDDLTGWVKSVPRPRMIIIDTLQMVRGGGMPSRVNAYAQDYAAMSTLKSFADANHVAVVLVHHLNKMKDVSDPYDKISGSTGLMGAADTTILISRDRDSDDATVTYTGRDVWGDDFGIRMNNGRWEPVSQTARAREAYERDPIVLTIRDLMAESFGEQVRVTLADFKEAVAVRHGGVFGTKNALSQRLNELIPNLRRIDGIQTEPGKRIGTTTGIYFTRGWVDDAAQQIRVSNGV